MATENSTIDSNSGYCSETQNLSQHPPTSPSSSTHHSLLRHRLLLLPPPLLSSSAVHPRPHRLPHPPAAFPSPSSSSAPKPSPPPFTTASTSLRTTPFSSSPQTPSTSQSSTSPSSPSASSSPLPIPILGIAYGFLAATMAIQKIWQKHYHILAKRELTKEYVVEDLHGCYTPPKLDPEHEERQTFVIM